MRKSLLKGGKLKFFSQIYPNLSERFSLGKQKSCLRVETLNLKFTATFSIHHFAREQLKVCHRVVQFIFIIYSS